METPTRSCAPSPRSCYRRAPLPPARWTDLAAQGDRFQAQRLLLAWFADEGDEREIAKLGFDGAIRTDPGDYVYPVDSNVAPASKLNAVTDRQQA